MINQKLYEEELKVFKVHKVKRKRIFLFSTLWTLWLLTI